MSGVPPLCGYVILHKAGGQSSMAALTALKKLLRARYGKVKLGHAGTLDPLASGVLPVALGRATKTISIIQNAQKTYHVTIRWGIATDSNDADGRIIARRAHRPSTAELRATLPRFVGPQTQHPPIFSAVHVHGQRAYKLARQGMDITLPARLVHIHALDLLDSPHKDEACLRVRCSKGTYIRALVRDLAHALGTKGHVQALTREAVGHFTLAQAHSIDALAACSSLPICPLAEALIDVPHMQFPSSVQSQLAQGQAVPCPAMRDTDNKAQPVFAMSADTPLALGYVRAGKFFPTRLLCFSPEQGKGEARL